MLIYIKQTLDEGKIISAFRILARLPVLVNPLKSTYWFNLDLSFVIRLVYFTNNPVKSCITLSD